MIFNIDSPLYGRINKLDRVKRLENSREREEKRKKSFEETLEEKLMDSQKEEKEEKRDASGELPAGSDQEKKDEKTGKEKKSDLGQRLDIRI